MEWSKLGKENKLLVKEPNLHKFVNNESDCGPQNVVRLREQYYEQRVINSNERIVVCNPKCTIGFVLD